MRYAFKKKRWLWIFGAIDAVGSLFHRPVPAKNLTPRRILVVRLDQLGDIVLALPFLSALRRNFPDAQVDVLTTSVGADLLRSTSLGLTTIVWDCRWFDRTRRPRKSWFEIRRRIMEGGYDCAFDLRGDARIIFLLKTTNIENVVGYGAGGGGFLLDVSPSWKRGVHEIDKNLALLQAIGGHADSEYPPLTGAYHEPAGDRRGAPDKIKMAVHPDAGSPAKRWEEARFSELMTALHKKDPRFEFHLIGTNAAIGGRLKNQTRAPVKNHMGKTSVGELVGLLQNCDGLVTNDSGPAHVMAALNGPVWVLWSGTAEPEIWAPRGHNVRLHKNDVPCSPCALKECPVPGHPCMEGIGVGPVVQSVSSFYERIPT